MIGKYTPADICDFYPEVSEAIDLENPAVKTLMAPLKELPHTLTVSLSGGVDSMVMIALLKYMDYNVNAVHIVYGNREESEQEYAFIASFCKRLNIPLQVYKIPWLKRSKVEREFYEKITRDIRFMVYRASSESPILLGHISEDVIENIWTNIANAQHLHNLKKMEPREVYGQSSGEVHQQSWLTKPEQSSGEVTLIRPFLQQEKETIYSASKALSVPYLKNTTPSWSKRGKFRTHFHGAVKAQYGPEVDTKIIQFAEAITRQSQILDRIIYQPIYKSFNLEEKTLNITPAVEAQLDMMGWSAIFEHICHRILGINKPSQRCLSVFVERLQRLHQTLTINMHKYLQVKIQKIPTDNKIMMQIILIE